MRHRVRVVPVRLRDRPDGLGCDRLRVVGYRATCECGWRGTTESTVTVARLQVAIHAAQPQPLT